MNRTRLLIKTRQSQPALRNGTLTWLETGDPAVLAFRRSAADSDIICVFNLSDEERPSGFEPATDRVDLLSREGAIIPAGQPWMLQPFAAHWLQAE
ncbi:MAG: alpha-glucosidase C-terminal domain-containing protein [Chloroflexota bacterium]